LQFSLDRKQWKYNKQKPAKKQALYRVATAGQWLSQCALRWWVREVTARAVIGSLMGNHPADKKRVANSADFL